MAKFLKNVAVFTILFTLATNIALGNIAFAKEKNNIASTGKTNFVILSDDLNHFEYTYDENGKSYKVTEHASEDLTNIESEIYIKNAQGEYELYESIDTTIESGIATVKISKPEGVNSTERININSFIESVETDSEEKIDFTDDAFKNKSTISPSSDLTSWQYSTTVNGSNNITRYTVTFVVAVLTHIVITGMSDEINKAASVGISAVATRIVADNMPKVYFRQYVYYKYIKDTDPPLPRAERTVTYFYADSSRTEKIGDTVYNEYYVPGWS